MTTAWRPTAALHVLRARAAMLAAVRTHFAATGALEVETPLLSAAAVSDVHLESVPAAVAGVGPMFLHTSPEYPMKRLLAAGIGDCYQICRVFRDGERGRQHNPEFTMIEWYRVGAGLETLMDDVAALVALAVQPHRTLAAPRRASYREAVRAVTGIDPLAAPAADIESALRRAGVALPEAATAGRDELLDLLVSAVVGPALGRDAPLFVRDFPASQAALARLCPGDPSVAERFELYIDGMELANGFHELADATEQRRPLRGGPAATPPARPAGASAR